MTEAEKERFVLEQDAKSRFVIKAINLADSNRIAQLGPLSHDALRGGFIIGNGRAGISRDASFVRFPPDHSQAVSYSDQECNDSTSTQSNTLPESISSFLWMIAPRLMAISPYALPELFSSYTGQSDFVFLSRSLGWDRENIDNIRDGLFVRSFADNITPPLPSWTLLPISDHIGFRRMDVFNAGAVFTGKTFKFARGPRYNEFWLPFKPEHPGVYFVRDRPPASCGPLMVDTDIDAILNGLSPAHAWLNSSGNMRELDIEIFRGYRVQLLWWPKRSGERRQFEVYLHFFGRAKEHGISATIIRCEGEFNAIEKTAVIAQAYRSGLKVPDILKEKSFVSSSCSPIFINRDIPCFWTYGCSVLIYGIGSTAVMLKLLNAFLRPPRTNYGAKLRNELIRADRKSASTKDFIFPQRKIQILCPASSRVRLGKILRNAKVEVDIIAADILSEKDALERLLCLNSVEVLFIAYADILSEKDLVSVLDMCEQRHIATGFFSEVETVTVFGASMMELVSRHFATKVGADDDTIFVRDVVSGTEKNYQFYDDGIVSVTDSDETSINRKA